MEKLQWDATLRSINRLLAGLVFFSDEYVALARKHQVPLHSLRLTKKSSTDWFNILDYFVQGFPKDQAQARIIELLKEVQQNFPGNTDLSDALEWKTERAEEPVLEPDQWKGEEQGNFEKLINGASTLLPISFLEKGVEMGRSVGRILTPTSVGTGFLLPGNYVLTNHHVIQSVEEAAGSQIEFNYQTDLRGNLPRELPTFTFDPQPSGHFATNQPDDWCVIKLKEDANADWGAIPIAEQPLTVNERVSIIQHPGGKTKQIGMHNNFVKYVDEDVIQYLTDTLPGSSGSPVFNTDWELVGLHSRGGYMRDPSTRMRVFRNAGIRIGKVLRGIQEAGIPGF